MRLTNFVRPCTARGHRGKREAPRRDATRTRALPLTHPEEIPSTPAPITSMATAAMPSTSGRGGPDAAPNAPPPLNSWGFLYATTAPRLAPSAWKEDLRGGWAAVSEAEVQQVRVGVRGASSLVRASTAKARRAARPPLLKPCATATTTTTHTPRVVPLSSLSLPLSLSLSSRPSAS